jgi:hypothetical protein
MSSKLPLIAVTLILTLVSNSFAQTNECKVDEYSDIICDSQQTHLDLYAQLLLEHPELKGYIIVYGGRKGWRNRNPKRGEAKARAASIMDYFIDVRGLNLQGIKIIDGGFREKWTVQLYACPRGNIEPPPKPTVKLENMKFTRGKIKKGDYKVMCM